MESFFKLFAEKLRLSNPWRYKAPLLMAIPYFLLVMSDVSTLVALKFIWLSYLTIVGIAGIGYLINDYADREKDALAGKANALIGMKKSKIRLLFILFLMLAIIPWVFFPTTIWSLFLLLLELLLFAVYSLPPFRLKERGLAGVVNDALYAHVVPAMLAAYTFWLIGGMNMSRLVSLLAILVLWQGAMGLRNILLHQMKDGRHDVASGTRTMVTTKGVDKIEKLTKGFLVIEILFFLLFCFTFRDVLPLLSVVLVAFWSFRWWDNYVRKLSKDKVKINFLAHYYLDDFYIRVFPLIIIFHLIPTNLDVIPILVSHIVLFPNVIKTLMAKMFWWVFSKLPPWVQRVFSGHKLTTSILFHMILVCIYMGVIGCAYSVVTDYFNEPFATDYFFSKSLQALGVAVIIHSYFFSLAWKNPESIKT